MTELWAFGGFREHSLSQSEKVNAGENTDK